MTFSIRTISVHHKECGQRLMGVHVEDKIYGPYQKISHTRRSNQTETDWGERETIFYHHLVDKGCNYFVDKTNPFIYYNVLVW